MLRLLWCLQAFVLSLASPGAHLRGVPSVPSGTGGPDPKPSEVTGCPADFKDCGVCQCVPENTCQWCEGPGAGNGSNTDPDSNVSITRPSSVVGCPDNHVDCGSCLCVPETTCTWCPTGGHGVHRPSFPPATGTTPRNSTVPFCPTDYVDCGSCLCVPEATCSSCPHVPVPPLPVPLQNISSQPSAIPGCPEDNVDCGSCLCVPESSCRWCPGAEPSRPGGSSPVKITKPSKVPLCPSTYVDCGRCNCVAEATCQFCGEQPSTSSTTSTLAITTATTTLAATTSAATTEGSGESTSTALTTSTVGPQIVSRPSLVPYCPASYVDCGTCLCVSEATCILCPGAWSNPSDGDGHIVSRPSEVPYCPASYVDCGTCLCVPESSCQFCPGAWSAGGGSSGVTTPAPTSPQIVARPSTVPYCPASYVDCGTCLCVPHATCQWCPGAYSSSPVHPTRPSLPRPRPPMGDIQSRPSRVVGCPRSYVDCGSCLCVPVTSCQWCPGALRPLPSNPSPPSGGDGQPSRVPGCPAHYVDCGTCLCVPPSTCQWCPGGNSPGRPRPPRPNRPVTPVEGGFRPSTVPGCPASYVDCGSCLCVPDTTCQWCPGATSPHRPPSRPSRPSRPPAPINSRPSTIIGCPGGFVDCGSCRCVPENTCQYCPGARGSGRLLSLPEKFEGFV